MISKFYHIGEEKFYQLSTKHHQYIILA